MTVPTMPARKKQRPRVTEWGDLPGEVMEWVMVLADPKSTGRMLLVARREHHIANRVALGGLGMNQILLRMRPDAPPPMRAHCARYLAACRRGETGFCQTNNVIIRIVASRGDLYILRALLGDDKIDGYTLAIKAGAACGNRDVVWAIRTWYDRFNTKSWSYELARCAAIGGREQLASELLDQYGGQQLKLTELIPGMVHAETLNLLVDCDQIRLPVKPFETFIIFAETAPSLIASLVPLLAPLLGIQKFGARDSLFFNNMMKTALRDRNQEVIQAIMDLDPIFISLEIPSDIMLNEYPIYGLIRDGFDDIARMLQVDPRTRYSSYNVVNWAVVNGRRQLAEWLLGDFGDNGADGKGLHIMQ